MLKNKVTFKQYEVYCHMAKISNCGNGGWTLVMKVDGDEVNEIPRQNEENECYYYLFKRIHGF